MYRIKEENLGRIGILVNKSYADILGITPQYISNILTGKLAVKQNIAKGILSIAYNIPIGDEEIDILLEKHFEKVDKTE